MGGVAWSALLAYTWPCFSMQHDKRISFTQKEEAAAASETVHEAGREVPSGEMKTDVH